MRVAKDSQIILEKPVLIDGVAAAKLLGISPKLLATMAIAGEVPSTKLHRRRLYSPTSLEEWAAQRIIAASKVSKSNR